MLKFYCMGNSLACIPYLGQIKLIKYYFFTPRTGVHSSAMGWVFKVKTLKSGVEPYLLNRDYSTIKGNADGQTLSRQTCFVWGWN